MICYAYLTSWNTEQTIQCLSKAEIRNYKCMLYSEMGQWKKSLLWLHTCWCKIPTRDHSYGCIHADVKYQLWIFLYNFIWTWCNLSNRSVCFIFLALIGTTAPIAEMWTKLAHILISCSNSFWRTWHALLQVLTAKSQQNWGLFDRNDCFWYKNGFQRLPLKIENRRIIWYFFITEKGRA